MVFVTVDLGANWKGDFKLLYEMVSQCKKNKINAVKFQCLSNELIKRHKELSYYKDCSISKDNIEEIRKICESVGISWYCTVTNENQINFLPDNLPVKVRCADSNKTELIKELLQFFPKVFVSSTYPIQIASNRIINLYCIPKYPTEFGEINFEMIKQMDGYSNHCLNPLALFRAVRYGAKFIEFHLTPSKDEFAIDNKVSFTYNEMKEIMKWINPQ